MADEHYEFGTMDTEAQKETYHSVMDFAAKWGTPVSMGLAAFFTSLLIFGFGFLPFVIFFVTLVITRVIATTFFAH